MQVSASFVFVPSEQICRTPQVNIGILVDEACNNLGRRACIKGAHHLYGPFVLSSGSSGGSSSGGSGSSSKSI